jgi:exoribonuclease-2
MDRYRHTHGALTLETREARPVFEGESLIDLEMDTGNRAKQLIENLMVAANTAAAEYLVNKGFPSLRRALRSPERWDAIVSLAAGLGETLPAAPDAPALERFLTACRARDPAKFADVSLAVVKLLGRGEYVVESPEQDEGHFALAVNDYSHSPRRIGATPIWLRSACSRLPSITRRYHMRTTNLARHCTEQGANAVKVERQVRKSAAALLLAPRVGEVFDAIVTGASQKGVWVQIAYPFIEGKLLDGAPAIEIGAHVRVKLVRTDAEHGFIDFERIAA